MTQKTKTIFVEEFNQEFLNNMDRGYKIAARFIKKCHEAGITTDSILARQNAVEESDPYRKAARPSIIRTLPPVISCKGVFDTHVDPETGQGSAFYSPADTRAMGFVAHESTAVGFSDESLDQSFGEMAMFMNEKRLDLRPRNKGACSLTVSLNTGVDNTQEKPGEGVSFSISLFIDPKGVSFSLSSNQMKFVHAPDESRYFYKDNGSAEFNKGLRFDNDRELDWRLIDDVLDTAVKGIQQALVDNPAPADTRPESDVPSRQYSVIRGLKP